MTMTMTSGTREPRRASGLPAMILAGTIMASAAFALDPGPVAAQWVLLEGGDARLEFSGYLRAFTGIYDRGFDLPDGLPPSLTSSRTSGFHSQVGRAKWQLLGEGWRFELHDRVQVRVPSGDTEPVIGLGVSTIPERLVDLETELVSSRSVRAWHDVDRLSVSLYTGVADVTVGRQAITWGVSSIFPVADLWARFSPFELDTEEKPGIDAVRALFYPVEGLELDAVVADRGRAEDLSIGLRGTYAGPAADFWAGAGKFWREAMVMGGVSFMLDQTRLRGELVLPWDLEDDVLQDPRATLGFDWLQGTFSLTGEYHFNGIGASDADRYAGTLQDARFTRGETYYLGRHYLGGAASWSPDQENRASLALSALANLQDGSAAFTPLLGYDLGQTTRLSLGGLLSVGKTPALAGPDPRLRSEFGTYGNLLFTRISVFF